MPPNLKGGKAYKKNSKKGADDSSIFMIDRQPDQQIARVIKILGNRNMSCYCNDNKIRICHVRGKMRGRVYVELGDIVLVSLRDFEEGAAKSSDDLRGDILAKYPYDTYSKLKKEDGINPKLFMQLETIDGARLSALGESTANTIEAQEDGFEFDRGDANTVDDSDTDNDKDGSNKTNEKTSALNIDAI